ncbi:putative phosphoesterase, partial [Metarhizium anisopliae]
MQLNLVEATISDLQTALSTSITATELVARYLQRIAVYDTRGPALNSVVHINPGVFEEAAASDDRRANGATVGPLEGIPYLVKDGFKYKGMTVSAGSPAFKDLISNEDAFLAEQLKAAGAICIGKTNMPPMAAGGMQRGLYGRAESPYNPEYLTAAFWSGSSNGSATAAAASFAAFSVGTETVSSGRSPASNNALVAYTPSRGIISCRGVWPLYPTCDVVVPHTRTVSDMLTILDVLTRPDPVAKGDFWREQPFVKLPPITAIPHSTCADPNALRGRRFAVPKMYIGLHDPQAKPTHVSSSVKALFARARSDIEALGGTVIETDFPAVTNYEDDSISKQPNNVRGAPEDWNQLERGKIIAYTWDDFLMANNDPNLRTLSAVDGHQIFPKPPGYLPDKFIETKNALSYPGLVDLVKTGRTSVFDIPGMGQALRALEDQRKRDLEDWLDQHEIDAVVFPANGGITRADLEENEESARFAHLNGVKYSNGNRALRHLGIPTVSVTMGVMEDTGVPVNLSFAGRAYADGDLLRYAYTFEQATRRRVAPNMTPALSSDVIQTELLSAAPQAPGKGRRVGVNVEGERMQISPGTYELQIRVDVDAETDEVDLQVFVDGKQIASELLQRRGTRNGKWVASMTQTPVIEGRPQGKGAVILAHQTLVMVRTLTQLGAALAFTLIVVFFLDRNYRVLPNAIHGYMPTHHAGLVVTDVTIVQCSSLNLFSSCDLDPTTWHRIDKELYLGRAWTSTAYLYISRKHEEDLTSDDKVVMDISVGRLNPAQAQDAKSQKGKQEDWESRPGGLWIKRSGSKKSSDSDDVITDVDVLFGDDAVEARDGWAITGTQLLLDTGGPLLSIHLTVRRGAPKERKKPEPRIGHNGKFKIMQIGDLHLSNGVGECREPVPDGYAGGKCEADPRTLDFVNKMLDEEKPDFVVLSGDQVNGDTAPDAPTAMFKIVSLLIKRKIPYAGIFGNHDDEKTMSRARQMALMESLPFSLSRAGPADIDGIGNYYVEILARSGQHSAVTMYLMDTHAYSPDERKYPGYDWLKQNQIEWFRKTAASLKKAHSEYSHTHMDIAFIHIPLTEYASPELPRVGEWKEGVTAPVYNSGFRDALVEQGVLMVSAGHDHCNDYCLLSLQNVTRHDAKPHPDQQPPPQIQKPALWMCYAGGVGFGGYAGYGG